MHDDEFSNVVRSGAQHSVTVSERTGNAKTPKNIVTSNEEETEARRRAFEEKEIAALEAEKALAEALAEHAEPRDLHASTADNNIQKVNADKQTTNRQAVANDSAAKANVQNIDSEKLQDNIQSLTSDKRIESNRQGIATDAMADNQQSVVGNNIAANKQNIAGEKALQANHQGIPIDTLAANQQSVADDSIATNRQSVATDGIASNMQAIDNGTTLATHVQPLTKDDVAANRQTLGQQPPAKHVQGIPTDTATSNEQAIAKLGGQNNQQSIEQNALAPNRQPLGQTPAIAANHQTIGTDDPSLNRQAAPQDAPPSPNRQGVENGKIQSHFEPLPSETVERKKVDFPTSDNHGSNANPTANVVTADASHKAASKLAPSPRVPMTAEELQEAKRKREKFSDEFHGRLAGIKHNVEELNERLSDFEEKVQKDDAKLIKGNPNDFKVDLG